MLNKIIVHLMDKSRVESERDVFISDINAMEEMYKKYGIENVIYYNWEIIQDKWLISKYERNWILLYNYLNNSELKDKVIKLNKFKEIIFISTLSEIYIDIVNEINIDLWNKVSDNTEVFRNKYLQRELIQKYNSELWVKFLKWKPEELSIDVIEEKIWYPFIVKPTNWMQSAWVEKINDRRCFESYIKNYNAFYNRLKIRWIDNKFLIIEEFIDGKFYSIDYFVTLQWKTIISRPVKVKLWIDFWIDDYCNIARIITKKTENEFKWKSLKMFINSTVKATGIRNIFIHHEFKINTKWEFKTIELNWRIWGWRLWIIKKAYDLNLYEFVINPNVKPMLLKNNVIVIYIYSIKKWILIGFNEKIFSEIEKRRTIYSIEKVNNLIWKEVWLTKDGYVKVWIIKMQSKDYDEIMKDYFYIKKKYNNLLEVD